MKALLRQIISGVMCCIPIQRICRITSNLLTARRDCMDVCGASIFSWLTAIGATLFDSKQWLPAAVVGAVMLVLLLQNSWRMRRQPDYFLPQYFDLGGFLALVAFGRGRAFWCGNRFRFRATACYTSLLLVFAVWQLFVHTQRWLQLCYCCCVCVFKSPCVC